MGRYLDISRRVQAELREKQRALGLAQCEKSEISEISPSPDGIAPLVSFNSYLERGRIDADLALTVLARLHAEHAARLSMPGIARVSLSDWREALRLDSFKFWSAVRDLEVQGRIIREGGYARPTKQDDQ